MSAALALPEVVTAVVESFLNEDLHRFLTENQLGSVVESFPETFCGKDDAIFKYFKRTKGVNIVRETLCDLNITGMSCICCGLMCGKLLETNFMCCYR